MGRRSRTVDARTRRGKPSWTTLFVERKFVERSELENSVSEVCILLTIPVSTQAEGFQRSLKDVSSRFDLQFNLKEDPLICTARGSSQW